LQSESIPADTKAKLREVSAELDPLKLLEEVRAMQAHLAALADGEMPPPMTSEPPNLAAFVAGLSSAWHAGEIRPTFSMEAKPRYLRSLQKVSDQLIVPGLTADHPGSQMASHPAVEQSRSSTAAPSPGVHPQAREQEVASVRHPNYSHSRSTGLAPARIRAGGGNTSRSSFLRFSSESRHAGRYRVRVSLAGAEDLRVLDSRGLYPRLLRQLRARMARQSRSDGQEGPPELAQSWICGIREALSNGGRHSTRRNCLANDCERRTGRIGGGTGRAIWPDPMSTVGASQSRQQWRVLTIRSLPKSAKFWRQKRGTA
jgi:hypothetical protein